MSSVAIAFLFNYILATNGGLFFSLAQLITGKRTTVDLLGKNPQAMFAAIGVMAWQYTPFSWFISALASYPLARMRFKLRSFIYGGIVAMMSIPMHVTLIPIFKMTNWMGLYDNLYSLLGPYVAFALPMSIYILTGFMMTIPKEVEEAAVIDGCNKYSLFYYIFIPLSKSGLSTLAIYNGVTMWNEFAFANTLLQSAAQKTLPLALGQFKGEHSMDMPIILSVLVLSVLPMIILFIVFQDKLVKGMMSGAVKG